MSPDVPTTGAVADDLLRLTRGLAHWTDLDLQGLKALPSVRCQAAESASSTESIRPAQLHLALRDAVQRAIGRVQHGATRLALNRLIDFDHPDVGLGDRQERAGEALGVGLEAMRKGRTKRLMQDLASEIYRGELMWYAAAASEHQTPNLEQFHPAWYRIREVESEFEITDTDPPGTRLLERRLLRCVGIAQPIVLCTTNVPHERLSVDVLSGQDRGDFSHRFLGARPSAKADDALTLLVFDLGLPLQPDEIVELAWRETAEGFVREELCHGYCIASLVQLDRLTLRVKVPPDQIDAPYGRQLELVDSWLGGQAAPDARFMTSESLEPDAEGFLTYEVKDVSGPFQYELRWRNASA